MTLVPLWVLSSGETVPSRRSLEVAVHHLVVVLVVLDIVDGRE